MSIGRLSRSVAVWLLLSLAACGGGTAIQSPVTVMGGHGLDSTTQAILEALPKRGWTAETVQPGMITAFLAQRRHLLRVQIRYDARAVNVFYVDSDNLAAHIEPDGRVYAHPAVNKWIHNLARDIAGQLSTLPPPAGMQPAQPQQPMAPPPAS